MCGVALYAMLNKMRSSRLLIFPLLLGLAACSRDPKVQAQRYLENGNKFFDKGKFKEASIMYRRALQKDLRFGEAYYRLGLTDLKLAAYGDAGRVLRRAVELQPGNADAAMKLADLFLLASTRDGAQSAPLRKEVVELSGRLLQRDPKSYDGHRLRGQIALLNQDFPAAIGEFDKANAAKPYQPNLVLSYCQALTANNQFPEAEKLARDLIAKEKAYAPIYDFLYVQYARQNKINDAEQVLRLKVENNPARASYQLQLAAYYYLTKRRPDMDAVIQRLMDEKRYPEGHLLAGDFYFFRLREYDHARQQYEAAIKAFPKDRALYQKRLVELYATTGKNSDANELVATLLKDNPKDTDAIAMRAALMLTTGNRDQINMAANDLQALVTKTPDNHLLRYNLARADLAKGDSEAARLQLEEAVKLRPDFIVARELLGRLYLAKRDPARALKTADEIILLDRRNLQAHLIRSSALVGIGDRDRAREELDAIIKNYPQNPDAKYQVAYLAWQDKDYKRAEQEFGELYKAYPNDLRGVVGVAETMASENRLSEAIKVVQTSVDHEPQRRDLKLALANLYVRAERYDEAIQIFQSLLDQQPKSADLLFRLAETERRKGELNVAIDSFRRCSQAAPTDVRCLLQLGKLMDGTGKHEQAKPIYEQILKIEPDHPIALNNLAFIKAEEGNDLDQALAMAQRARQKDPNAPEIADTLGWIYIKKNLSEDAIRVFQDLVEKAPGNPTFHYHFAMALLQKGDRPSAKKELETAMKDKPSKDEVGRIQDLLQKI
jgi:tetratricopeptide (TPR) repeat protein